MLCGKESRDCIYRITVEVGRQVGCADRVDSGGEGGCLAWVWQQSIRSLSSSLICHISRMSAEIPSSSSGSSTAVKEVPHVSVAGLEAALRKLGIKLGSTTGAQLHLAAVNETKRVEEKVLHKKRLACASLNLHSRSSSDPHEALCS